jgi:hypothetical protein
MLHTKELAPVFDSVLDFAQSALMEHEAAQNTISQLQSKIAQNEQVILEKVAAARSNALDTNQVQSVLDHLVQMRLLSFNDSIKVASKLKADPNASLALITKMAEMLVAPSEGRELDDVHAGLLDDPDGWGAMADGKTVRIRQ